MDQYLSDISHPASPETDTSRLFTLSAGRGIPSVLQGTRTLQFTEERNTSFRQVSKENVSIGRLHGRNKPKVVSSISAASSSRLKTRQLLPSMDFMRHTKSKPKAEETTNADPSFKHYLSLTAKNMQQCFANCKHLTFHAKSGKISVNQLPVLPKLLKPRCNIKLFVPAFSVLDVRASLQKHICKVLVLKINGHKICHRKVHNRYQSPANMCLTFLKSSFKLVRVFLNFTTFPLKVIPSPSRGYVQSPGWDGKAESIGAFFVEVRVDVPANYSMMISFLQKYNLTNTCRRSQLTIASEHHESLNLGPQDWVLCQGAPIPKPAVLGTNAVTFHYMSSRDHFQFKVLFSFHHVSAVPEKTTWGKWNCSVPHWSLFRQHLGLCNTVDECYGEEDEANCSHVYRGCGRGSVLIGGRCYQLLVQDTAITWYEAANECLRRDTHLASLNTPDEWDDVTDFFEQLTNRDIYFGLRGNAANLPQLYRSSFQWNDESVVIYFNLVDQFWYSNERTETCSYLTHEKRNGNIFLGLCLCYEKRSNTFLCEKDAKKKSLETANNIRLHEADWLEHSNHVTCPLGHAALKFMAYGVNSECFNCQPGLYDVSMTLLPPYFTCRNDVNRVPYTLVCDHRPDCSDNSDENFCFFPLCRMGLFRCDNHQCVLMSEQCDRIAHCVDGTDETNCRYSDRHYHKYIASPRPPAVINFDGHGFYEVTSVRVGEIQTKTPNSSVCPKTHFLCPGNWTYCLPVFVRCNGMVDCPGREDEEGCDSYACPGLYRCRASSVCVHARHVCDGVFHCPQHDDELLCGLSCPHSCTCYGLALFCPSPFPAEDFPDLRYLDGHGSQMAPRNLTANIMLIFLNLADCGLKSLDHMEFPNLHILDLSRNQLTSTEVEEIDTLNKLQMLSLAGNPLTSLFTAAQDREFRLANLEFLDVSDVSLVTLNTTTFSIFPALLSLNLSGCGVQRVDGRGFQSVKHIRTLDLTLCPMEVFPADIFKGIRTLTKVWADNYRLCCPAILPAKFHLTNCHSPSDEISSCDALLRSDSYRIILFVFSVLALAGNLCSFVYRVFINRRASHSGFGAFVTHLCVSDFLMGVYLAVIGVADRWYMGSYLWNDAAWKRSAACSVAGFLSLLSSEVSAFVICLITIDRFIVLRFPFSRLHFRKQSAHVACGTAWLTGVTLAGVPLLPVTSHWEFYSQTGICIPLPITKNDFAGYSYSFSVTIIVNFILFLLIAVGQAFVFWSVRTNSVAACNTSKKSNNQVIARRLIAITMSDFLCWFPVGFLGLLASTGVPIPGEVNVLVAILLLPVNSAINPFIYTLNVLLESRRKARDMRIQKMIMSKAEATKIAGNATERLEDARYTKTQAMQLIETWVCEGLVSTSSLEDVIKERA